MNVNRYRVAFVLLPLLAFSWLLLAIADPNAPPPHELIFGYVLGTMFAQPTLAAAWTALGPGPLLWRLPLSLGWVASLAIALAVNIAGHGQSQDVVAVLVIGACLAAQWLVVQLPLWGLAVACRLRLRHAGDPPETARDRQFGIRQVMILTGIVAVVLGACRLVVGETAVYFQDSDWKGVAIFGFLAFAGIVMNLPLLVAALLPRHSWLAVAVVLILIALGTWYEVPLLSIVGGPGGGPGIWDLAWINAFQAAWILAVVGLVRLCGYGIGPARGGGESPFASMPS